MREAFAKAAQELASDKFLNGNPDFSSNSDRSPQPLPYREARMSVRTKQGRRL